MRLTWRRQRLRTRHRFATAQGGLEEKETLIVELEHEGIVGLGEATPSQLYGQTLESTEAALAAMADRLGADPFRREPILRQLIEEFDSQRAAVAAVDSALHDWAGKRLGVPVWRLLGLDRPQVRTTFTIGIARPEEVRRKVREALAEGYDALKVKVGVAQDLDTLGYIRSCFEGPLLLDANEAWTAAEAPERIEALRALRPTLIEQPLRRADEAALGGLRRQRVAPIFADESCQRPADVVRLHGLVDGINIKLSKCGGIREALRMIALARGLGMQVMLGCFVSSSLAIAPALTIASLADYADLDGHLLLARDPYTGLTRRGSLIGAGDGAGLGVRAAAPQERAETAMQAAQ